jgi:transposase
MTRRKFTSKFKTKVVLEALKERLTAQDLAQKFEISPQQVNLWKREFLSQAETLLKKYEDHPHVKTGRGLLPVPSNQNYNVYLKELADLSKINKTSPPISPGTPLPLL